MDEQADWGETPNKGATSRGLKTKKMSRQHHYIRTAEPRDELADAAWTNGIYRHYAWNHNAERIQLVDGMETFGWVVTREVRPSAHGVLEMPAFSGACRTTDGRETVTYAVTKDGLTITRPNRTDDE